MSLHIVAFAASDRVESFNQRLLTVTLDLVDGNEQVTIDRVEPQDHAFPLFSQNIENESGIPEPVQALFDRFGPANAVLIAVPEYNGGYTPLYKNTIDWLSRIEMRFLQGKYIGLLSASPGPGGGVRGQVQARQQLENMRLTIHEQQFAVPSATDNLDDEPSATLEAWVDGFLTAAADFQNQPTDA